VGCSTAALGKNMTFDAALRAMIVEVVREELAQAAARPDEYLSTSEAAGAAKVAPGTVRRWVREGRLPPHHAGRLMRVNRADLERMLTKGVRLRAEIGDESPEARARRMFG
jgi:excisionase family DNA binding protein